MLLFPIVVCAMEVYYERFNWKKDGDDPNLR